ncbi:MAG TPA: cupin domain-containing protein [Solirubrobacteraceae bacterium]|nr:cupin domain-containing protein [Solirubrobacteraceae bacterium]
MGKTELEFFDTESISWSPVTSRPGVSERILARDPNRGLLTRMVRWEPGLDTSSIGPVAHDYYEEVLILSGSMRDVGLQQTFSAGFYACRPPGMVHGPWITRDGCVMLEIQYADSIRGADGQQSG